MTASFCRQTDSVGKRVADDRAFAVTGGNDGVAGSVFSGIQNGIAALCADIGLGTFRLNLFELLLAVRVRYRCSRCIYLGIWQYFRYGRGYGY